MSSPKKTAFAVPPPGITTSDPHGPPPPRRSRHSKLDAHSLSSPNVGRPRSHSAELRTRAETAPEGDARVVLSPTHQRFNSPRIPPTSVVPPATLSTPKTSLAIPRRSSMRACTPTEPMRSRSPSPKNNRGVIKVLFPTENNVFKTLSVESTQTYADVVNLLIEKATKGMFPEEKKSKVIEYRSWELLVSKKSGSRTRVDADACPLMVQHDLQNRDEFDKLIFQPSSLEEKNRKRFGSNIRLPSTQPSTSNTPPPLVNQDSFLLQALRQRVATLEHREKLLKERLDELKVREANTWIKLDAVEIHREKHESTAAEDASLEVAVDRWKCTCREVSMPDDENLLAEINTELNFLESLPSHPNIVHYLHHTIADGKIRIFTSSFNTSLQQHIRDERLRFKAPPSVPDVNFIANEIIEGLEFLKKQFVFNCELSSSNVFVRYEHKTKRVLGVALGNYDLVKRTVENNPIGKTPTAYIPAEHYSGPLSSDDPSARLVFAFGMILYEVLAGKPPYRGLEPVEIRDKVLAGERPHLPASLSDRYASLVKLFMDCTQRGLKDRLTLSQLRVTVLNLPA